MGTLIAAVNGKAYLVFAVILLTLAIALKALESSDSKSFRLKRQSSPISRAWQEALPGVQPFWEKYSTGPYGVVIRGWQFSRCASEQVSNFNFFYNLQINYLI